MLIIPPTDINTCVCKCLILAAWNKVDSKEVIQAKGNLFFGAKLPDPDIESRHFVMKIVPFFTVIRLLKLDPDLRKFITWSVSGFRGKHQIRIRNSCYLYRLLCLYEYPYFRCKGATWKSGICHAFEKANLAEIMQFLVFDSTAWINDKKFYPAIRTTRSDASAHEMCQGYLSYLR